jgi:YidC/Oxa1 family membrane protein insertase
MEKRLFIAVLLSIAFLAVWAKLAPRFFPELVKPQPAAGVKSATAPVPSAPVPAAPATTTAAAVQTQTSMPSATPVAGVTPAAAVPAVAADRLIISTVDTKEFTAHFSNRGAQLISFQLKHYRDKQNKPVELVKAREPQRTDFDFAIEASDLRVSRIANSALYTVSERLDRGAHVLEYRLVSDGIAVTKVFRVGDEYQFGFNVQMQPAAVPFRISLGPGIRTLAADEIDNRFATTGTAVVQREGSLKAILREKAGLFEAFDSVEYIGLEDNYFLAVLRPERAGGGSIRRYDFPAKSKDEKKHPELYAGLNAVPGGGIVSGQAFFGPKQANLLEHYGLEKTLQFGMFGVIARFLLTALIWINSATHNYGFAIIVLTILIKIVLYPLQHKSIVSMKKMQKVQPKMAQIRDRYKKAKTDPEQRNKMNLEMMNLYKQENISPMSGCLPILLQLPILWGFYGLLSRAIELRGAPFIWWIHDLAAKDPYYITPVLMTATMFIQQLITPTTADPAQKRMFMFMPLIFGWIFKEFPSGLVLYWLVQNILTIIQQSIMNKYWKDHPDDDNGNGKKVVRK